MKKSVFFIAMLLMGTTYVTAQEYVMFGAKGGVNFSNLAGDGFSSFEDDSNARTSFHLGLVAEIPLSARFSLQPEVVYSGQGYDVVQIDNGEDIEFRLDYINVPVMAKLYVFDGFALLAGPQIGFLVKEEIDYGNSSFELPEDSFNTLDVALGLGAEFNLGNLSLYGRYNAGLTDIYKSEDATEGSELKNSVIQVGAGLRF